MQYKTSRQRWNALSPSSKPIFRVMEILQNNSVQKRSVKKSLPDSKCDRERRARSKLFPCVEYECSASEYSKRCRRKSEERMERKEVRIDVASYKLLERYRRSGVLKFSWRRE